MNKAFKFFNILLIAAILIGDILYITLDGLLLKSITSLLFVALGLINFVYMFKKENSNKKFNILMLIGLTFAMLGDILLEIEFIIGAALFAIAHIFYFAAYNALQKFKSKNLIYSLTIFIPALLIILFVPLFDFGGTLMQVVCIIYALIISIMVGKAISNLISYKSFLNIMLVVGSALFFFSDFMLLFNVFADVPKIFGILCLATYYPAEVMLAMSILKSNKNILEN